MNRNLKGTALILTLLVGACYQPEPVQGCETYQSLSAIERKVVSNGEKALLKTGKAHDFAFKCILVGEGNGGRFVAFEAPVGKTADDMPTDRYGAKTSMDGETVKYINLTYPYGEWVEVEASKR